MESGVWGHFGSEGLELQKKRIEEQDEYKRELKKQLDASPTNSRRLSLSGKKQLAGKAENLFPPASKYEREEEETKTEFKETFPRSTLAISVPSFTPSYASVAHSVPSTTSSSYYNNGENRREKELKRDREEDMYYNTRPAQRYDRPGRTTKIDQANAVPSSEDTEGRLLEIEDTIFEFQTLLRKQERENTSKTERLMERITEQDKYINMLSERMKEMELFTKVKRSEEEELRRSHSADRDQYNIKHSVEELRKRMNVVENAAQFISSQVKNVEKDLQFTTSFIKDELVESVKELQQRSKSVREEVYNQILLHSRQMHEMASEMTTRQQAVLDVKNQLTVEVQECVEICKDVKRRMTGVEEKQKTVEETAESLEDICDKLEGEQKERMGSLELALKNMEKVLKAEIEGRIQTDRKSKEVIDQILNQALEMREFTKRELSSFKSQLSYSQQQLSSSLNYQVKDVDSRLNILMKNFEFVQSNVLSAQRTATKEGEVLSDQTLKTIRNELFGVREDMRHVQDEVNRQRSDFQRDSTIVVEALVPRSILESHERRILEIERKVIQDPSMQRLYIPSRNESHLSNTSSMYSSYDMPISDAADMLGSFLRKDVSERQPTEVQDRELQVPQNENTGRESASGNSNADVEGQREEKMTVKEGEDSELDKLPQAESERHNVEESELEENESSKTEEKEPAAPATQQVEGDGDRQKGTEEGDGGEEGEREGEKEGEQEQEGDHENEEQQSESVEKGEGQSVEEVEKENGEETKESEEEKKEAQQQSPKGREDTSEQSKEEKAKPTVFKPDIPRRMPAAAQESKKDEKKKQEKGPFSDKGDVVRLSSERSFSTGTNETIVVDRKQHAKKKK